jgi:hypothetical protein
MTELKRALGLFGLSFYGLGIIVRHALPRYPLKFFPDWFYLKYCLALYFTKRYWNNGQEKQDNEP